MPKPLCILPAIAVAVLIAPSTLADGKAFLVGRDRAFLGPLHQHEQRAFLSLHGGTEHMLIAISVAFEEDDVQGFWLFPVPGTAANSDGRPRSNHPGQIHRRSSTSASERIAAG